MTKEEMKAKMSRARQAYDERMQRVIDFVVDTVNIRNREDYWGGHSGWGLNSKGVITANYNIFEDGYICDNSIDNYTLWIHEQKHRDNMENGIYEYPMSWEQAYKSNMHDEISATMTELLQLREEYLQTGDISIFDKEPKLSFYKEAIKKGEVKPGSIYKEDFDKEMSFIVNGTRDMWVNQFGSSYVDQNLYFAAAAYDASGKYAQYYDENYERAKKIAYNIGGVDFTKYMDKDVEIPNAANVKMIEDIAKSPTMQEYYCLTDAQVFEKSGLPPYDGSVSLYEYKQLLQHQMAVNNFTSNNKTIMEYDSKNREWKEKECTPQEYLSTINIDKYKKEYEQLISSSNPYAEQNKKDLPTFEAYLKFIPETQDFYEKFDAVAKNEAFIDKIVEYQAQEYAKTGKDFPQSNPENYQQALNKLYCGAYDVLKPDETELKSELSKPAEKLQSGSAWERTMENYLKSVGLSSEDAEYKAHYLAQKNKVIGGYGCFVGGFFAGAYNKAKNLKHRMTHITDEKGEEQNVGLWGKIKHKAAQIKKDLTTETKIDENGKKLEGKCSIWKGLKKRVSSWFKSSSQPEQVKNEPINPVNTQDPQYPEWKNEDGHRVSPVQHRPILDMRKPIIKQPVTSRSAMQCADKSDIKNKMNNDCVKAKGVSQQQNKTEKKAEIRGPGTIEQFKKIIGLSR